MGPVSEGTVILGFPRSGTTLLRRLLNAHSQLACPSETYLLSACTRFFQGHRVGGGVTVGVASGMSFLGFEPGEIERRVRELVFRFYREFLARSGKERWIEKTATDSFHADEIDRLFGNDVTYIVVVRHALDVVVSVREWCEKMEAYPPELLEYVHRYPQPLEAFVRAWVDVSASLKRLIERRNGRVFLMRYEDLVESPREMLERVTEFLGVVYEPAMLESALEQPSDGFGDWRAYAHRSIKLDRVRRWKTLSATTRAELASIVNPTLAEWGYDQIPTGPPLSEAEALRRYELALRLQSQSPAEGD